MKLSWAWLALLLAPTLLNGQALNGAWVASNGACMEFHPTNDLLMLDPASWYGGWRNGRQRFEYVLRKDRLVIRQFHNQSLFSGLQTGKCVFRVDAVTQSELGLSLIKERHGGAILETIGGDKVIFHRSTVGCLHNP